MDSYSLKKIKRGGQKISKKLVSKPDIMLSFGVMYPHVSEKFLTQLTKPSVTKSYQ